MINFDKNKVNKYYLKCNIHKFNYFKLYILIKTAEKKIKTTKINKFIKY